MIPSILKGREFFFLLFGSKIKKVLLENNKIYILAIVEDIEAESSLPCLLVQPILNKCVDVVPDDFPLGLPPIRDI